MRKNNDHIKFKLVGEIHHGVIKGISAAEQAVIGRTYIVECSSTKSELYPYDCVPVFECMIIGG